MSLIFENTGRTSIKGILFKFEIQGWTSIKGISLKFEIPGQTVIKTFYYWEGGRTISKGVGISA
jgi:hypothetical protein